VPDAIVSSIQPIPCTGPTLPTAVPRGNSTATDWKWDNVSYNPNTNACTAVDKVNATVLRRLGQNPSELDVTNEFTTTEFWEQVTKETNLYASECLAQIEVNPSKHKSYDEQQWFPVTVDEMKADFALCILI
jgi:hypothetical protein